MIELPENPYSYPQYTEEKAYDISQKDMLRRLGDNMISRATAGFKALPDGEDGLRKGYWQAYMDIGQELVDKLAQLEGK